MRRAPLTPLCVRADEFERTRLNRGDTRITLVTDLHSEVVPGSIFVAVPGTRRDGHDYLGLAHERGAALCVGEWPHERVNSVPAERYWQVPSSRRAAGELAAWHLGDPASKLKLIGVTGTSGKTTLTYLLDSILRAAGHTTGLIGTVEYRVGDQVLAATHTTPGAIQMQRLLAQMVDAGVSAVTLEVSSHALDQARVWPLTFDAVGFSNLSPEHLDYHGTMDAYLAAKARLFDEYVALAMARGKSPVIALSDATPEYRDRLVHEYLAPAQRSWREARRESWSGVDPNALSGIAGTYGVDARHSTQEVTERIQVRSPLVGAFNQDNLALAIELASGLGIARQAIERGISQLNGVPGRLERVGERVWVDYAHKPDALKRVLETLRQVARAHSPPRSLCVVVGCGGDRDRAKRPQMGKIAAELADQVWVTSDNPRSEDPMAIIEAIVAPLRTPDGLLPTRIQVEPDRERAIRGAITHAPRDGLVVIVGKGHEREQILGQKKIPFDDRQIAKSVLTSLS